jgi:hypothetical protein
MGETNKTFTFWILVVFFLIILAMFLFYSGIKLQISGYTLTSLNETAGSYSVGNPVQVNISIADVFNLSGIQIDVIYDSSILSYDRTEEGDFLNEGGLVSTYFNESEIGVTPGNLDDIIIFREGEPNGASGTGILASIYFNATQEGTSYLNLTQVLLSDPDGGSISSTISNTTVVVSSPGSDQVDPVTTLDDPGEFYNTTSKNIVFNATASDNIKLVNMTFYSNFSGSWTANITNSSPVESTKTKFSVNGIPEGYFVWNVYSCDNSSNCAFASSNRSLIVDLTPPSTIINYPLGTVDTNNVTINISFIDNVVSQYCSYNITNSTGDVVIATNIIACYNSVEYQTIEDGSDYVITTFVNDTTGNSNITNQTFSIDTAAPPVFYEEGGGGGGGGGGGTTTTFSGGAFSFSPEQISLKIKHKDTKNSSITITNIGASTLDFTISSDLELLPLEEQRTLIPGESSQIAFDIFIGEDVPADFYLGNIYITAENTTEQILISVEVISERVFVLLEIDLPSKYVYTSPGEKIRPVMTLSKIRQGTSDVVEMGYTVRDERGEIHLIERETLEIGDVLKFGKDFKIPDEIPYGKYIFYARAENSGEISSSSRWFVLQKPGFFLFLRRNIIWILPIILALIVAAYFLLRRIKRRSTMPLE